MGRPTSENPLRIPETLRQQAEEILRLTDGFCADHLDAEYGELCRKLVAELARKRPSPLLRGDLRVDARRMPPEIQAEARRKGLIPDLPVPMVTDAEERE